MNRMIRFSVLALLLVASAVSAQPFAPGVGEGDSMMDSPMVGGGPIGEGDSQIGGPMVGGGPIGEGDSQIGGPMVGGDAVGQDDDDEAVGGETLY